MTPLCKSVTTDLELAETIHATLALLSECYDWTAGDNGDGLAETEWTPQYAAFIARLRKAIGETP